MAPNESRLNGDVSSQPSTEPSAPNVADDNPPARSDDSANPDHEVGDSTIAPSDILEQTLAAVLATFPILPDTAATWISFGLLAAYRTFPHAVAVTDIADVLNAVGVATVAAGLVDVQFSLSKRTSKAPRDLEAIYGIVVDVDRPTNDIVHAIEKAGTLMPNVVFPSPNGFKLACAAVTPIAPNVFAELAMRATLAFEAGDPRSWDPGQMQRLPTCLRIEDGAIVPVAFTATLTNAVPLEAKTSSIPFPFRVRRALGAGALGPLERARIREYLDELGISAPEDPGHLLYAACPASPTHGSPCCYINVADDGELSVHCLGGHEGEGAKHWSEADLAELAGASSGDASQSIARFDPLKQLPVTAGAIQYIRFSLRTWAAPLVRAVIHIWTREWARRDALRLKLHLANENITVEVEDNKVLAVYDARTRGVGGLPPMLPYYERGAGQLVHDAPDGRALAVSSRTGPNLKTNAHELKATALHVLTSEDTRDGIVFVPGWVSDAVSLVHKLAVGHTNVLAKLGVPAITTYALPVAHTIEHWEIHPSTFHIAAVTVRDTLDDVEEIDAVEFFLNLFRAGRLPLASEDDVRRFVMAIASPLLRHIAPGLLGVYWFVAVPGAGKDFMAEMPRRIWERCGPAHMRVSFDLSLAGELENKRMFEMAAGCVYARAKEAGKRQGMADALIRFAGTDSLPGRGLFKEEINVPNVLTYVAESAEDMPDRREISRRTVHIGVTFMDDKISKGEVLEEILKAARGIVKNLKRIIEAHPAEWYLRQADTGSRPVVPVALAKIFGVILPSVEGEDLTEVFEAMAAFTSDQIGREHGAEQLATLIKRRPGKASLEATTVASYSIAFFIDSMAQKPGKAELFSPYARKSKELINRLQRETDYRSSLTQLGYMSIDIGGVRYAFRIEDGRRFILWPEVDFNTKMTVARAVAAAKVAATPPPVTNIGATAPTADTTPSVAASPPAPAAPAANDPAFRASGASLLKKKKSP